MAETAELFDTVILQAKRLPSDPGQLSDIELRFVMDYAVRGFEAKVCKRRLSVSSWSTVLAYLKCAMAHEAREQFRVLFLDRKNQLIADEVLGQGTVDHAPVYPREVMKRALELGASAVILVHNHPSGDPAPSSDDVVMTKRVIDAGRALSIGVHDHVVVGRDGVASMRALGLI